MNSSEVLLEVTQISDKHQFRSCAGQLHFKELLLSVGLLPRQQVVWQQV